MSYSTSQNDGQLMIVVTVMSDRLVFDSKPTMMLMNFKGEVLKLEGYNLQARSETSGVFVSNVVIPITELNAMAEFPVNAKDIGFFASGIAKVRLSTVPIMHEREFSKDAIGKHLYNSLRKARAAATSF